MDDGTKGYVNGLARGELFVIVIPDLIRDPWIAGRARNDKFEGCNDKPQARNDQAGMTAFVGA
jgi:hypothetical protein